MGDPAQSFPPPLAEQPGDVHDGEWTAAWNDELARRIGQIERGEVELLDGEQVMAEMRALLAT